MSIKIDFSLNKIWLSWFRFSQGKRTCDEIENFRYHLEDNLWWLHSDLIENKYVHGGYRHFIVKDNKRRDIAVACVRDRVVHRLVYDYLVDIFDHTFIYDAWSCRIGKGLLGAIERTQKLFKKHPQGFVWRGDVKKFFDNVDRKILFRLICRKIIDKPAKRLIKEVIDGDNNHLRGKTGIPIGNLTSQIFANIYLNELDRFVKYRLKPLFYLRYGDDFIIISSFRKEAVMFREEVLGFLTHELRIEINAKNDIIIPVKCGIRFLGVEIYPTGRRLKNKIWKRVQDRFNQRNVVSYHGLVKQNYNKNLILLNWLISQMYD